MKSTIPPVVQSRIQTIFANGAGWSLLAGSLIFSGTVFALALGSPRWLGAITPIGGVLFIVGFLVFAWAALAA